ncbi:MAG: PglZ domain-containing protein [Kiritimatiellae bacterium]|nr:PglZ domain-containing protein [Kiritimatiellia bacterium]
MKAEEIKKHFETSGRNVAFLFAEDIFVRDEIMRFDLGADTEIVEYKGDAFVLKHKIRTLPKEKRLVVLVSGPSPLATGEDTGSFPLLGELMANGECKAQTPVSFMAANGMNTGDAALAGIVSRHLAEMTTGKGDAVFGGQFGTGFTAEKAAQGLVSIHLGAKEMWEWREIFANLFLCDAEEVKNPKNGSKAAFLFKSGFGDVLKEVQGKCRWYFGAEGQTPKGGEIGKRGFFSTAVERLVYNAVTRPLPVAAGDPYTTRKETDAGRLDRMEGFLRWASESLPEQKRRKFFGAVEALSAQVKGKGIVAAYGATARYGFYFQRVSKEILRTLAADGFGADSATKAKAAERVASSAVADGDTVALARTEAAMARFYVERAKIATFARNTREEMLSAYTGGWWRLDREYRLALEHLASIANDECRAVVERAKEKFETDAQGTFNEMNLAWTNTLNAAGGAVGIEGVLAQEDFYEKKKDPSVKMAVVVSDALRYEVALEVMDRLNANRGAVTMEAGIAHLPTETQYTKATLLPHTSIEFQRGQALRLDGGKPTVTTADKQGILQAHCTEGVCVTAKDLKGKAQTEKRAIFKNRVVYVFHDSIDHTGHGAATGQEMAGACREAVDELVKLIQNIQNTCNVNHVWLVADHGFLLCDRDIPDGEKIPVEENEDAKEKTTRYYFTERADPIHAILKVALPDGGFVAVPAGTRRFKANGSYTFVHGGASLQEMVIPVMHSRLLGTDATRSRAKVGVTILGTNLRVQSSRIKFELLQNEAVSAEMQERTVLCALYADSEMVSNEVRIKLDSTSASLDDRKKVVELVLNGETAGILTLKVFADGDSLNALDEKTVTNETLIPMDNW